MCFRHGQGISKPAARDFEKEASIDNVLVPGNVNVFESHGCGKMWKSSRFVLIPRQGIRRVFRVQALAAHRCHGLQV